MAKLNTLSGPKRDYPTSVKCSEDKWHGILRLENGKDFCPDCWRDKVIWKK
jgi:hypothetical protein